MYRVYAFLMLSAAMSAGLFPDTLNAKISPAPAIGRGEATSAKDDDKPAKQKDEPKKADKKEPTKEDIQADNLKMGITVLIKSHARNGLVPDEAFDRGVGKLVSFAQKGSTRAPEVIEELAKLDKTTILASLKRVREASTEAEFKAAAQRAIDKIDPPKK